MALRTYKPADMRVLVVRVTF